MDEVDRPQLETSNDEKTEAERGAEPSRYLVCERYATGALELETGILDLLVPDVTSQTDKHDTSGKEYIHPLSKKYKIYDAVSRCLKSTSRRSGGGFRSES
jgi:hypothetical protein